MTNLDMQKVVYFVHGHYLLQYGRPLVNGEFEAWSYGPVHRVLYDALKRHEDLPINEKIVGFDPIRRRTRELPGLDDSDAIAVLDQVLDHYLNMPTFALVELTHRNATPWSRTIEDARTRVNVGMKIPNELIVECFEGRIGPGSLE